MVQERPQRAPIKLLMIRHYKLREWVIASQYDITAVLALFVEADFL
jgi:hypothetical protein